MTVRAVNGADVLCAWFDDARASRHWTFLADMLVLEAAKGAEK